MFLMLTEDPNCTVTDADGREIHPPPPVLVNADKIERVEPRGRMVGKDCVDCCEIYLGDGYGLRVRESFETVAAMLQPDTRKQAKRKPRKAER